MPITSFAAAFALGRAPAQEEQRVPRPQSAVAVSRPDDTAFVVPDWLADSVKFRAHGGSEILTEPPAPEPGPNPSSRVSLGGDAHEPAGEHAMGELAAPDRSRVVEEASRQTRADVDQQAWTPPVSRTLDVPRPSPQGVAPAPAEGPGVRFPEQKPISPPATVWTIRTNDGLAYQGTDKAALEMWAAARNAELTRTRSQWSYQSPSPFWAGYGYPSGGCAGGSCR